MSLSSTQSLSREASGNLISLLSVKIAEMSQVVQHLWKEEGRKRLRQNGIDSMILLSLPFLKKQMEKPYQ